MTNTEIKKAEQLIAAAEATIESVKKTLEELRLVEQAEQWKPTPGKYCLYGDGNSDGTVDMDVRYCQFGTSFKDEKSADEGSSQFRIYHWMYHAWLEVMDDDKVDWGDCTGKFVVLWNHSKGAFLIFPVGTRNQLAHGFHFNTHDQCEQWAHMVGHLIPKLGT